MCTESQLSTYFWECKVMAEFLKLSDYGCCPECGGPLEQSEGCEKCNGCGWSGCG